MSNLLTDELKVFATKIDDSKDILEFKGRDLTTLDDLELFQFCKANKSFKEPGLSAEEIVMLHEVMKSIKNPLTIVETGICFGVTTRYFIVRNMKYGGELYSFEINIREQFESAMKELGLWNKINVLGHSMKTPWDKNIDFLFIDSEHALSDALGEYMRFRVYLTANSIVGFHDSDTCYGVKRAIEIIHEIDDLELIGEVSDRFSAGIKFFKVKGLGQKQVQINQLYQKKQLEKNK